MKYLVGIKYSGVYYTEINAPNIQKAKEIGENRFYEEIYDNYNVEVEDFDIEPV